jgi:hypothetical protein
MYDTSKGFSMPLLDNYSPIEGNMFGECHASNTLKTSVVDFGKRVSAL